MNKKQSGARNLAPYLRKYKKESIIAPLFKLLEALFDLCVPLVVAAVINNGISAGESGKPYIYKMCGLLLCLALVGLTCSITAQYFAAKAAVGFSTGLRSALFSKIQKLSFSDLDHQGISELENRMTGDVNQLQNGVNLALRLLLRSPFIVVGAMIMAFTVNVKVALIFVAVIPVLSIIVAIVLKTTGPRYKGVQSKLGELLGITRENFLGVRVIRAFAVEDEQQEKFKNTNKNLFYRQTSVGRISALLNPMTGVIINIGIIAILYNGGINVSVGNLAQGDVVALIDYMSQILVELLKLANTIVVLSKAMASADRVSAVLEIEPEHLFADNIAKNDESAPSVEFNNVSFTYGTGGEDALKDINFKAYKGQTIGVIGATASGKSTLAHLIAGYYRATAGEIKLSGTLASDYTEEQMNKQVALVMQKAVLFKGTIKDNLTMGNRNATDEEIEEAISIAQAKDVVNSKKMGLDEEVEQGGRNFSGGQKQRLSIARTLLKKSPILILDDSSSALDYATDAALRTGIANRDNKGDTTTFIITQRTAGIMYADNILVLDEGRLVGQGTHEELLNNCEVYREIYDSQFSGMEQSDNLPSKEVRTNE